MPLQESSSQTLHEASPNGTALIAAPAFAESWGAEELAATLDSVATGIWAVDLEGRCVFVNQAACRIFGYSREECQGQRLQCMLHRHNSEGWNCPKEQCRIQQALESGSAAEMNDEVFLRRDGTPVPVQCSIQPAVVQSRMRSAVISVADNAPRKRAEESLRKSDEWLGFAGQVTGVGLFDADLKTGETRVSEGQFLIYGLDPAGRWPSHEEWLKLIHPEDRDRMDRELQLALSGAQFPGTEFRIVWPDGSIHWLLSQLKVFFDEAGTAARQVGINVDVTDRVRAERVLSQLFSASSTPFAIWSPDGLIRQANRAWEPILGYTAAELEGLPVLDLVHPEDRAAVATELEKLRSSGNLTGFECRSRCKDGSYRWLLINANVLEDAQLVYATGHDITRRKRAEEALRSSEARFRSAFENTLFGMAITNLDGRFLEVNQILCRMIGFPEQELLQMDVLAITHPNDVQESREFMHALTKGVTSSSTITKRCLRKDGDSVWTCAHVTLERDPQGKPLHFIALIEDLTERKRAEENARRSEESLGFTLDAVGIGLCHRESGETMASDHQFRLYGIEPAEKWLTRERWLQSIHPEDRERVETEQRLAMEQGKPYVIWFRVVWPDGSVHWLACRGKVFGTRKMEVTIDVTERKRAEAALEGFFALSRSPMSICGFDGTIKRVNAALLETSGFTAEELAQRLAPEFFHSDDRAMIQEQFQKLIAQGGDTEFECRGLRRDGSCCWLLFFATAAPDEKLIFTVAYDVTERKRMTEDLKLNVEKLARSNEELERFAYVASHDLQEPLRMVASFTQLLAKRYSGRLDETADRYINYAVDGAKRMQQLIADLLAYSRVNSQELNLSQTDCETVVLGAMRNLEVAIKESGAAIDWDPLPVLWADQRQLILLFQNLLANAIKFRRKDECPRIHVSSVDSDAEWIISVQDNGIGIDARHAERIFQVFQRLHTRQEYPGTGIGLAVCKKVVERHGGKLWVEAEPGAGCTFRFTIPKPKINGTGDHSANQTVRDSVD